MALCRKWVLLFFGVLAVFVAAATLKRSSPSVCQERGPVRLFNDSGVCVHNSLLQLLYAGVRAVGASPSRDGFVREVFEAYSASAKSDDPIAIDPLCDVRSEEDPERVSVIGSAMASYERVARACGLSTDEAFQCTVRFPSRAVAVIHQELEQQLCGALVAPQMMLVVCDYENDPMDRWDELYHPRKYTINCVQKCQRPQFPARLESAHGVYRAVGVVNMVQQYFPTSESGRFVVTHAPDAWKRLQIPHESHATASVRWGDRWFYMDDTLRYELSVTGSSEKSCTACCDNVCMNTVPGIPLVILYVKDNGSSSCDHLQGLSDHIVRAECRIEHCQEVAAPDAFGVLHDTKTHPYANVRLWDRSFIPV